MKPSYTQFWDRDAAYCRSLRIFGEMAVVANVQQKIKAKMQDRGNYCIFLGYCENHECDVYHFWDLKTKWVRCSRDATWLNKLYGEWKGLTPQRILTNHFPQEVD